MPYPYTEEQFKKIYANLPEDLREMVFSEERSSAIYEIAKTNDVLDFVIEIADAVEDVLIGFLPPKEFENKIKKMGAKREAAAKVSQAIDQRIFAHVRRGLIKLYEAPEEKMEERLQKLEEKMEKIAAPPPQTKVAPAQDIYREPVEEKR